MAFNGLPLPLSLTIYDDSAAAVAPSARPPPTRRLRPQALLILASQGRPTRLKSVRRRPSVYVAAANLLRLAGRSCPNMRQLRLNSYADICDFAGTAGGPPFPYQETIVVWSLPPEKMTRWVKTSLSRSGLGRRDKTSYCPFHFAFAAAFPAAAFPAAVFPAAVFPAALIPATAAAAVADSFPGCARKKPWRGATTIMLNIDTGQTGKSTRIMSCAEKRGCRARPEAPNASVQRASDRSMCDGQVLRRRRSSTKC